MDNHISLIDITHKWLFENRYHGLCNPELECGCFLIDLFPCGNPSEHCVAGHEGFNDAGESIVTVKRASAGGSE
jgi:hypothetical protein